MSDYSERDVPDQSGKTFFITGANSGIGFEAARVLAQRGARVLVGCRTSAKAEEATDRIRAVHASADLGIVELDLSDLASVRRAANQVLDEPRLDVLINNAGVMMPPRELTRDGFESQFGVNHLGHFALTGLVLPKLAERDHARVVSVSSLAHRRGRIDFDDVHAERSYDKSARYGMSKVANLLFTFELQRRLAAAGSPVIALACHPGGSMTNLGRHMSPVLMKLMTLTAGRLLNSSAEGALPTLRAATDPEAVGDQYYGPAGFLEVVRSAKVVQPRPHARDPEVALRLWDLSVELTGVTPDADAPSAAQ